MGDTAEQMAKTWGITRERQDALALRSHQLAARAWEEGKLTAEVMTAYTPPFREPLEQDNNIRKNSTLADYQKLRPAFDRKHGSVTAANLTLIDMHEAFAAQTLANLQCMASDRFAREVLGRSQAIGEVDESKFNVLGGSIAYGHPFAATGARMITQTLHELQRRGGGFGLVTACAAGGLGSAMVLEAE